MQMQRNISWMCGVTKFDRLSNERMRGGGGGGGNECGGNLNGGPRKEAEVVCACDAEKGALHSHRKEAMGMLVQGMG